MRSLGLLSSATDDDAFRQQESVFIIFNICTLLSLVGILIAFRTWMPDLDPALTAILLIVRAIEQCAELLYLRRRSQPFSATQIRWYSHASVWLNVAFAGLVSLSSNTDEAHYMVLLLLPVVSACFRYSFYGLLAVITAASILAFLELFVFYLRFPPMEAEHFFEMATMVLIYPVIGMVAWMLVKRIRNNAAQLETALAELQRTRDRLVDEEKHAAIGRLASAMAHEIRNPVAMIVSALDGERREIEQQDGVSEYHQIASREAARLERLTTDFLAYARSKAPEWSLVPIFPTLDYIGRLTAARAADSEIRIELHCADDLVAWMDEFLLHQALLNLTLNAVEHTPSKGVIHLGATLLGEQLELFVENSGEAIPSETVPRLFEPFFTTRSNGTGLGLAISQRIAERHGGEISLTRNQTGAVRFTLTIPQVNTPARGANTQKAAP